MRFVTHVNDPTEDFFRILCQQIGQGPGSVVKKNRENIRNGFRIFLKVLYTTLFHHKYGTVVEKQAINKTRKIHLTIIHVL